MEGIVRISVWWCGAEHFIIPILIQFVRRRHRQQSVVAIRTEHVMLW